MIAEVIVDIAHSNIDKVFDYVVEGEIKTGMRVLVPFGAQKIEGYVIRLKEKSELEPSKLKSIICALEDYSVLPSECVELMFYLAKSFNLKLIDAIRLFIPAEMRRGRIKELKKNYILVSQAFLERNQLLEVDLVDNEGALASFISARSFAQRDVFLYVYQNGLTPQTWLNENFSAAAVRNLVGRGIFETVQSGTKRVPYKQIFGDEVKRIVLNNAQNEAVERIKSKNKSYLLHGVTGSGKTEVYMNVIESARKQGKTAIMLVPEIALTPQVLKLFRDRFKEDVAILHSALSAGERFDEWHRILNREAGIVVGARSAIFAPLEDIGAIIIDEEHDPSYLSERHPRYNTIDVAQFRREFNNAALVLGSATPSIESYFRASTGEYELVSLSQRVNYRPLPKISIVDMKKEIQSGNNSIFSRELSSMLEKCMERGEQAMLFINRRGFSSYMLCRSCGYIAKCDACDVSLVYHRDENLLKCHYCENRYKALDVCPLCKSIHIKQGYAGTERLETELKHLLPSARVLRMDRDTTSAKDSHDAILRTFREGEADILLGTQMIAKGHDFSRVTLVGIIDADLSLYCSGYLGNERTFQLITQVAGRAGRENLEGAVVLQSYQPNHYVYRFAKEYDYKGFYDKEINIRETTKYPPFSRFLRLLVSGESEKEVLDALKDLWEQIKQLSLKNREAFLYSGRMRAPISRIKNKYRFQVIVRLVRDRADIERQIFDIANKFLTKTLWVDVEINPTSLS